MAEADRSAGLGRAAARGGALTLGAQLVRALIQAAALIVLARLLAPADFGILAMVVAIVGLGELVRDLGLSNAAIQAPSLTRGQRDNLFWTNLGLGLVFGLALFALAPLLATFYDTPAVTDVARWLALTFLINGFAAQYRANLLREMKFGVNALLDVLSAAGALGVAVAAATNGGGIWALVAQELTRCVLLATGLVVVSRWLPGLPRKGESIRSFVRYGIHLVGTQLLGYASRNVDTVVLGARFGAVISGLYSRAYQLMALPITQLSHPTTKVALPVLSRLNDEPRRYQDFLLRGQTLLLHLLAPAFTLCIMLAEPVVLIALGPQWSEAASILRILAIGGIFEAAAFASTWVFLSKGATAAQLRFTLVTRPVIIVTIVVASRWGPEAVAAAYAAGTALTWPLGLWWIRRHTDAPAGPLLRNGARALVGYGCAGAAAWALTTWISPPAMWFQALLGIACLVATTSLVVLVWPRFRADLRTVLASRKLLRAPHRPKE